MKKAANQADTRLKKDWGENPAKTAGWERAFSRTDLMVSILTLLLLAIWLGAASLGERGRIARCASNLSELGKTIHDYANDNADAIPAAGINMGKGKGSWDAKLIDYLQPGLAGANKGKMSGKREKISSQTRQFFSCPSDYAPHQEPPRSYAMSRHDMLPEHWPPGADSQTGLGLWWSWETVPPLLGMEALKNPGVFPAVKLASVPAPSDTILLTEFIDTSNCLNNLRQITVAGPTQQQQFFKDRRSRFHYGKFNYLMVDGHVELLSALQTGSFDGSSGIWSLKKGD
jgi:prepilin-type processing-associated H-X9-DG protein